MASINATIALHDKMSAPINKIISAMDNMISACSNAEKGVNSAFDSGKIYEARQAIDQASKEMEEFENHTKKADVAGSSLFKTIAKIGTAIGIAKIAKDAIEFASNLTEVQNVVDVTFGQGASVVDDWAKTTLNAFGLNELSAKKYAGTMGAMLKSSGLSGEAVSDMAMRITELSGDMASFYNLSNEEAFSKIRSGISGETEPLKQLGINMSVANLEAFALSQGIEKAYSQMSQAEQVTLRYNYLMQAAADAQGDFARTSDSFANQQKLLTENWRALAGQLASNILPILAKSLHALNSLLNFVSENLDWLTPLALGLAGIVATIVVFTHTAQIAAAATAAWGAVQVAFNAIMAMNPIAWIIIAVIALIAVIVAVANHIAKTSDVAKTAFGVITGGINVAIQFFVQLWNAIKDLCSNIPIAFNNAWYGAQEGLFTFISNVLNGIARIGQALNALPFVSFDMSGLSSAAQGFADKASAAAGKKADYKSIGAFQSGWASDAFASGAAWGDKVAGKISDGFTGSGAMANLASDVSDIAANTGGSARSLEASNETLKYLRDIAERDAINRFTTAEIKIDMTNNNNINSNMDLDGIVSHLTTAVHEAMFEAAEGVHA